MIPLVLWSGFGAGGCSCQPDVPPPPPAIPTGQTGDTGTTGDTSPELPCAAIESEPNDASAPDVVVMEQRACGSIDPAFDVDTWSFSLQDEGWLSVEVDAASGSIANMTLTLTPQGESWGATRANDPESLDTKLVFPAPADDYLVAVSEETFNGGERFAYEVLVSEAKPPVEWSGVELEPNDVQAQAMPVVSGDQLFGLMDGNGALPDFDWYVITVPAGKHTLTVDVDAWDAHSGADTSVYLFDAALGPLPEGCDPCEFKGGVAGLELDPLAVYDSPGAELVYIEVLEAGSKESPANWYVLSITLEDQ